jgi:hypothetical protein
MRLRRGIVEKFGDCSVIIVLYRGNRSQQALDVVGRSLRGYRHLRDYSPRDVYP